MLTKTECLYIIYSVIGYIFHKQIESSAYVFTIYVEVMLLLACYAFRGFTQEGKLGVMLFMSLVGEIGFIIYVSLLLKHNIVYGVTLFVIVTTSLSTLWFGIRTVLTLDKNNRELSKEV